MDSFMPYFWLIVIVVAAIVEGATAQLVSIWLVAGGIAALIAELCGAPIWLQALLFVAVTALTLLATRPFVKKMMYFKKEDTNAGRYIGKDAVVLVEINNVIGVGQVKVLGSIWTAKSEDGSIIPAGATVLVNRIEGVKLIVELKK